MDSFNQSKETWIEILYMVITGFGWICIEKKIVDSISHAEIRNVLLKHGIEWRHSKTVFGSIKSRGPEYDLKKAHQGAEE
jgi:hypothetical protein